MGTVKLEGTKGQETRLCESLLAATGEILESKAPWDVVRSYLGQLTGLLGASRVLWVEVLEGRQRILEVDTSRAPAGGLDEAIWRGLNEGETRSVTPERLARSARFLREGARQLTLCAAAPRNANARILWVESSTELAVTAELIRLATAGAAQLYDCAERIELLTSDASLKRRGVAALAMVHDLRHQLALSLLCAQRAREGDEAEAAVSLAELDQALSKAREISHDALGDSRPEEERTSVTRLRDVLQEEARTVGQIGGRGEGRVAIALRCARTLRIRGKESTLSRLVRNLLLNAYKASSAGDRVLVSAERLEERVVVRIEDSGKGMDERRVRQLFTSDTTESGGAGCGTLSILAGVDELGAELEVESTVGRGTRVELSLPVYREGNQGEGDLAVLLVDGNPARRARRRQELENLGERVLHVARIEEALFELERERPSHILVERGLPGAELDRLAQRALELESELRVLEYRDTCAGF